MINIFIPPCLLQPNFGTANARTTTEEEEKQIRQFLLDVPDVLHALPYHGTSNEETQQQELEEIIALARKCRIAISPHKRLPEDVLRYIFTLSCVTLSLDHGFTTFPLAIGSGMLFVLCRVCSVWRKILFEMPSLWSRIRILCHEPWHCNNPFLQMSCLDWLARAGSYPLSIEVNGRGWTPSPMQPPFREFILDLLKRPNLRCLEVYLMRSQYQEFISLVHPPSLQQLEVLSLISPSFSTSRIHWRSCNDGVTFPHLTSFKIDDPLGIGQIKSMVPWSSLRRLELIQPIPMTDCLELLQQCHVLEYCYVALPDLMSSAKRIEMGNLSVLHIDGYSTTIPFIDQFTLPALKYLNFDWLVDTRSDILDAIARLSKRSGTPKITEIFLGGSWDFFQPGTLLRSCDHFQFDTLLRSMPYLQTITFSGDFAEELDLEDPVLEDPRIQIRR